MLSMKRCTQSSDSFNMIEDHCEDACEPIKRARGGSAMAMDENEETSASASGGCFGVAIHPYSLPLRWAFVTSASWTHAAQVQEGGGRILAATIDLDTAAVLALQLCDASAAASPFGNALLRAGAAAAAARALAVAGGCQEAPLLLPQWYGGDANEPPPPLARGVLARLFRTLEREVCGDTVECPSRLSLTAALTSGGGGLSGRGGAASASAVLERVVAAWNAAPFASHGIATSPYTPAKAPLSWAALAPLMTKNVGVGASACLESESKSHRLHFAASSHHHPHPLGGSPVFGEQGGGVGGRGVGFFAPADTPLVGSVRRMRGEDVSIDSSRTGALWGGCV